MISVRGRGVMPWKCLTVYKTQKKPSFAENKRNYTLYAMSTVSNSVEQCWTVSTVSTVSIVSTVIARCYLHLRWYFSIQLMSSQFYSIIQLKFSIFICHLPIESSLTLNKLHRDLKPENLLLGEYLANILIST